MLLAGDRNNDQVSEDAPDGAVAACQYVLKFPSTARLALAELLLAHVFPPLSSAKSVRVGVGDAVFVGTGLLVNVGIGVFVGAEVFVGTLVAVHGTPLTRQG